MRRGYQTKRQFERSLHREPYLSASAARGREMAKARQEQDHVCGTCARFMPTPELVPGGVCGSTGEIVASVWSRPCWTAQTVPTDPTNPAAILRALVLQQPVEQTPDGLRVVDALTPDPADAPCADCPGCSPDCQRGSGCCDPRNDAGDADEEGRD